MRLWVLRAILNTRLYTTCSAGDGVRMDFLRAYEQLENAILTGELKPRERLVESDLGARLGVSRTPVREALRRLEERGLVRILPHRGAIVSDFSPREVESIYAVRIHLESRLFPEIGSCPG